MDAVDQLGGGGKDSVKSIRQRKNATVHQSYFRGQAGLLHAIDVCDITELLRLKPSALIL